MEPILSTTSKKSSKGHRCYFCGERFFEIKLLKKHVTAHKERTHTCEFCEKSFTDRGTLQKHRNTHTREHRYQCEKCGRVFNQSWTLRQHMLNHHAEAPGKENSLDEKKSILSCELCQKTFTSKLGLNCHKRVHSDKGKEWCEKCEIFVSKISLKRHLEKHALGKTIHFKKRSKPSLKTTVGTKISIRKQKPCLICKHAMTSIRNAVVCARCRFQGKEIDANGKFHCGICVSTFDESRLLQIHMREEHEHFISETENRNEMFKDISLKGTRFVCSLCGKRFRESSDLKEHLAIHPDSQLFHCDVCNSCFKTPQGLKFHRTFHDEEGSYQCMTCECVFKTLQGLQAHSTVHSESRPHKCSECGKTFKSVSVLKKHHLTHENNRSYVCHVCGKGFNTLFVLKQHSNRHLEKRPYLCDTCNKGFTDLSSYHRHMRRHDHAMHYQCVVCLKSYSTVNHLKRHMHEHSKHDLQQDVLCQECGENFKNLETYKAHFEKKHG